MLVDVRQAEFGVKNGVVGGGVMIACAAGCDMIEVFDGLRGGCVCADAHAMVISASLPEVP